MIVVAIVVVWIIMVFVIPSFKKVFSNFGADLPAPTLIVIAMSEWVVAWWWLVFMIVASAPSSAFVIMLNRRSAAFRMGFDRVMLKIPVIGGILEKATIARWTRTLQTMFAAGVPLVESLDAVGGASGNAVYVAATKQDPDRGQHRHQPDQRHGATPTSSRPWCCR